MAFCLSLLVTSCSGTDKPTQSVAFENFQTGAMFRLKGSKADFGTPADVLFYDSVSLVMPENLSGNDITALRNTITMMAFGQKDVPAMVPAINHWLRATAQEQGYQVEKTEANDIPMGFAIVNGYVVYLSSDLLVYCVEHEDLNPSNGMENHTKQYINYEILSGGKGNVLTISEVFTEPGLKQLPEMIADRAQDMSDVIGPSQVEGLPEGGNFFISSEGQLVFAYNPGELGSSAQGFVNIPFDFTELYDLLTPKAITLFGLESLQTAE